MNTRYYKGLFWETTDNRDQVVYTLKEYPWEGYPSLYQIYLTVSDPEEFTFATLYLDGFEHWEKLCESGWFKPYVKKYRNHLDKKLKSEAISRIIKEGLGKGKNSFSADKWLAEKGYASSSRGRPSKAEIAQSAFEIASTDLRLKEDVSRILLPRIIDIGKTDPQ